MLLFHSLVISHLKYGLSVWGKAASINLKPLQVMQNKAIRAVHLAGYRDSAIPLLNSSGVINVNNIYFVSCSTIIKSTEGQPHLASQISQHSYNSSVWEWWSEGGSLCQAGEASQTGELPVPNGVE